MSIVAARTKRNREIQLSLISTVRRSIELDILLASFFVAIVVQTFLTLGVVFFALLLLVSVVLSRDLI
ncbi:hypothetical protein U1Q18_029553 [Sarracenia purpurea var. burkii]